MKKILNALKICLTVAALSGCATIQDKFPYPTLKQPLTAKQVTREYQYNKKTQDWKYIRTLPYNTINGMFCISEQEYLAIRNWIVDLDSQYTCKRRDAK